VGSSRPAEGGGLEKRCAIRNLGPTAAGSGVRSARTISSDAQWLYVNIGRLFNFVEEPIEEGMQWVVFEPNDEVTWGPGPTPRRELPTHQPSSKPAGLHLRGRMDTPFLN
jgi:hypothetical protein